MYKIERAPTFLDRVSEAMGFSIPQVQSDNIIDVRDPFARMLYEEGAKAEEEQNLNGFFGDAAMKQKEANAKALGLEEQINQMMKLGKQ